MKINSRTYCYIFSSFCIKSKIIKHRTLQLQIRNSIYKNSDSHGAAASKIFLIPPDQFRIYFVIALR